MTVVWMLSTSVCCQCGETATRVKLYPKIIQLNFLMRLRTCAHLYYFLFFPLMLLQFMEAKRMETEILPQAFFCNSALNKWVDVDEDKVKLILGYMWHYVAYSCQFKMC